MSDSEYSPGTWVSIILGAVILIAATGFGIHACSVGDQATLGRAEENVRTQNFEQSEAYRAGLRRDFDELLLAYTNAKTDEEKMTVLSVIRHRAEGCPPDQVPQDIKNLLNQPRKP